MALFLRRRRLQTRARRTAAASAIAAIGLAGLAGLALPAAGQELPDIRSVPPDLEVPAVEIGAPAAGHRVFATSHGWEETAVYHVLYLPPEWHAGGKYPVLVEYPGNSGFRSPFGDTSDGRVEHCRLGYGISGGRDYIWVALPFVGVTEAGRADRTLWWGDADETAAYCVATVRAICRDFGGDEHSVILCGFSRGAIACNYIGLRNDEIASLWRGFICHSHYDGVRTDWPYKDADKADALTRLQRLRDRPQFISQEGGTDATRDYLQGADISGDFTFADFPFRNHTAEWALRDTDLRRRVRAWLRALGLPASP